MENLNWSKQRMGRLESLYREGLSFSLIAADIGVSRNAVIGKAHRMHLPKRGEIIQCKARAASGRSAPRRHRAIVRTVAMEKAKRPAVKLDPDRDYSCTIYDLKNRSCRYPLWEAGAPHEARFYCGVPGANFVVGVPYCRRHAAVASGDRQI